MRRFYGIDLRRCGLGGDVSDEDAEYWAALVAELPPEARLRLGGDPDSEWGVCGLLLRLIDLDLQSIAYGLAGGRGEKPHAVPLPSEQARMERMARSAASGRARVDEILGLSSPR